LFRFESPSLDTPLSCPFWSISLLPSPEFILDSTLKHIYKEHTTYYELHKCMRWKTASSRLQTSMAGNIWEQKGSQHWTLDLCTLSLKMKIVFQPLKILELESFLCTQIQTFRDTETTHKVYMCIL
jgi:hypothetical protein